MRKDVILGMSIGGVMLAIVIVYLTVSPNGSKNKHTVQTDGSVLMADGPGGAGDGQDSSRGAESGDSNPADHKSDARAQDTKPGDSKTTSADDAIPGKPTVAASTGEEKKDPRWGPLLWGNRTPLIGVSQTPDPNAGAASSLDTATGGDQSSSIARGGSIDITSHGSEPRVVVPPARTDASGTAIGTGPATQPSGKMRTHKVVQGETFSTIAATVYGSANYYPHLLRANPKVDPSKLKIGTIINLPDIAEVKPAETPVKAEIKTDATDAAAPAAHKTEATLDGTKQYRVVAGDSLHKIALKLYGKVAMVDAIYELNKTTIGEDKAKLKLGMVLKLPSPPTAKQ